MKLTKTHIPGLYVVEPTSFHDQRGFFARTFCKNEFKSIGFDKEFVQFNHSFNKFKGTLRGLHFQRPPYAETKYVRCVEGKIFDVAVDIRKESPTYLQFVGIELSAENMLGLLIPEGFAHGFQTLDDNTSIIYFHTHFYQQAFGGGLRFDDPLLSIKWPLKATHVSDRDKCFPTIDNQFEPIQL